MTQLFTTVAGGIALIGLALLLKWKKPHWNGLRAVVMLAGGIATIKILAKIQGVTVANGAHNDGWLQELIALLGRKSAGIPKVGDAMSSVLAAIATALPWVVAAVLTGWLLIDIFPRVMALRRGGGSGGGYGRLAGVPGGNGGGGGRLAGVHEATSHTMWVALWVPASIALVPPLAHALKMGG
jgi:hypothetical protein